MTALIIERVTDRHPSPPPTPRERKAQWAYRYYLLPVDFAGNEDPDNEDVTQEDAPL